MHELITKHFGQKDIRIIDKDGNPWFVAKDICDQLGYINSRKAISDHCSIKGVTICDTPTRGGNQKLTIINESNLYRLIAHSKLEKAKEFETWVYEEVLPAIRKNGKYQAAWLTTRQKSKAIRNNFTAALQEHGYKSPIEYIKTTSSMKKKLGIKGNKKKDNLDLIELYKIQAAESLAMINIIQNEATGYDQVKPLCDMSSTIVQVATNHGNKIEVSA